MAQPPTSHPTPEQLAAYATGRLAETLARAVAAHLRGCPACRQAAGAARGNTPASRASSSKSSLGPAARPPAPGAPSPPANLPPQLTRHPRYRILRELGRGGMGVVYQAEQTIMNRLVAIKVINQAVLDHPDARERFRREVRVAASLSHPNIVLAYDAEEVDGLHMLVMEYVEGRDLARLVRERGLLPVAQACDYVRQAALGLQYAHERGMVHRDIKPHNLLVTADPGGKAGAAGPSCWGLVKVLDMGLARLQGPKEQGNALTHTGAVIGTPEYLAPEQALDSRAADVRSDLYSLGCTPYYLLAGHSPFRGESLTEVLLKHQMGEVAPLQGRRPDVPEEVCCVVGLIAVLVVVAVGLFVLLRSLPPRLPTTQPQVAGKSRAADSPPPAETRSIPPSRPADRPNPPAIPDPAPRAQRGQDVPVTKTELRRLAVERSPPTQIVFSPDGSRVLLVDDNQGAYLYGIQDGRLLRRLGSLPFAFLAGRFTGDGRHAYLSSVDHHVYFWNLETGEQTVRFGGHNSWVRCLAVSPDGRRVLSGGGFVADDYSVRVWEADTGKEVCRFEGHKHLVEQVEVFPDGRRALSRDREGVIIWDAETGREIRRLAQAGGAGSRLRNLVLFPDGRQALLGLFGSLQDPAGHVAIWDVDGDRELLRLAAGRGRGEGLALSADGRRAVTAGDHLTIVNGKQEWSDIAIHLWELPSGRELRRFEGHTGMIRSLALSPDASRIVSASDDKTVRVWDTGDHSP